MKTSKTIQESMMSIEEFGELLNLEEELDKLSTLYQDLYIFGTGIQRNTKI